MQICYRQLTPFGDITLTMLADELVAIDLLGLQHTTEPTSNPISQQFAEFFANPRFHFSLPLRLQGTPFQQRVWRALRTIPVAETRSYAELATELDSHPRAIGQACRRNPLPIIIPCHRVIAANGHIGGFAGATQGRLLAIKHWLLQHEASLI